ncbi:MAG: glutaredoxin domain-containing protein [Pseudomonadota bacterium]
MQSVDITIYRWAGSWGPFKVNIPCGECSLTLDVVKDTIKNELDGIPVTLRTKDWLSCWWEALFKGGWHAPIVMVDGRIVSQGKALNRGVLTQAVVEAWARNSAVDGSVLFGKANCPHCVRAKALLEEKGVPFVYRDVVQQPRSMYEMLARVKPLIGAKTPVTVPQIWLNSGYVGGADALAMQLSRSHSGNPGRQKAA